MLKFSHNMFVVQETPVFCNLVDKPARSLEKVILCKGFCGDFKNEINSTIFYDMISVHTCFCFYICLKFRFADLAYFCFCAMLFSVSQLSIVNIFCCLCYMPGFYVKPPILCFPPSKHNEKRHIHLMIITFTYINRHNQVRYGVKLCSVYF